MASSKEIVDFVVEQISDSGLILAKKMFGEYAVYCDGKLIAMVCDDELFFKPTTPGRNHVGIVTEGSPYPGAKPHLHISGDLWDDRAWMSRLARVTTDALPPPKERKSRKPQA